MPGIFGGAFKGMGGTGAGSTVRHFFTSFGVSMNFVFVALIAIALVVVIVLVGLTVREYARLKKK